jgi:hypothetical protein
MFNGGGTNLQDIESVGMIPSTSRCYLAASLYGSGDEGHELFYDDFKKRATFDFVYH